MSDEAAIRAAVRADPEVIALAREARDAYRKIVESSRPSGQPNGLVVPRIPLYHWLGPKLDRLCAALGVDDAGSRAGGDAPDPRVEPVARVLCRQSGDAWALGRALWLKLAREVLDAADAADPMPGEKRDG